MRNYRVIGLMSGTSLDGVDAACCRLSVPEEGTLADVGIEVEATRTDEYNPAFRSFLESCCSEAAGPERIARADVAVADRFAETVDRLLADADIDRGSVDLLGSHGQTIWHAPGLETVPGTDRQRRATIQVGDGNVLARGTGIDTVSDFRTADVAAGGHGAPLSPILDWIQFGDPDENRIVQNVGGIGNCTVLPAREEPETPRQAVTAFDTGPGNMVIDAVVKTITDGRRRYDEGGRLAAAGTAAEGMLAELLEDPFFEREPPKSTGRERYGADYARELLERADDAELSGDDVVATATRLTADSIADAYDRHAPVSPDRVVVSGGGSHNPALVSMLENALDCSVETAGNHGIDPDFREAVLFALLAALFDADRPGNLPAVTGAEEPVVLGKYARGR